MRPLSGDSEEADGLDSISMQQHRSVRVLFGKGFVAYWENSPSAPIGNVVIELTTCSTIPLALCL